jgi:O-antigen ligase
LSIKKPGIALVALINIYTIRSFADINWSNPQYYTDYYQIPPSIIFSLILPLISFILILINIFIRNKNIQYPLDVIDILLFLLTVILLIFINFSPDTYDAIEYFIKFITIGISFYIIGKIYIFNNDNPVKILKEIFLSFYFLGIILSLAANAILYFNHLTIERLTLPGVHPIPFAQAVGMTFILSFVIFITNGEIFKIRSKSFLIFNQLVFLFITISLFATNTRGILFASIFSILIFLFLNPIKVHKVQILFFSFILFFSILYIITVIDISFLFSRLIHSSTDQSISDRVLAYSDSIQIFSEHIFGVGTNAFSHYSFLVYPHNLFLQNIAEYGIFGLVWNYLLIAFTGYLLYLVYQLRYRATLFILVYIIFIYYFIETMFSFTLWMHKGLYFNLGLLSYAIFIYNIEKKKKFEILPK